MKLGNNYKQLHRRYRASVSEHKKTHAQMEKFFLIDHCFISQNHIFEADIIESILENGHFTIVYQSSLKLEWKQQKTEYLMREKMRFTRSKFNRDIASEDWLLMYKNIEQIGFFCKFFMKFSKMY